MEEIHKEYRFICRVSLERKQGGEESYKDFLLASTRDPWYYSLFTVYETVWRSQAHADKAVTFP